jgi:NAD(P)-dependent dehydrogenase (short-subunit alcohol dehydrogenase family)
MADVRSLLESSSLGTAPLRGRRGLVTGAGRGIGFRVAEALALLGARVVIAEIDEETGARSAASLLSQAGPDSDVTFVHADVGDEAAMVAVVERSGPFDIVVNNAAATPLGAVTVVPLDRWDLSYRVNLRGPVALARLTVPGMVARGQGVFVCLSSVGGAYMGPYECLKAAGCELAMTLAAELDGTGVFAFAIGPGQVMTPGLEEAVRDLAPMYGMAEAEFLAMHEGHVISDVEAGVGIAAAIVLAERFHGSDTSSVAGLTAAGVGVARDGPAPRPSSVIAAPAADAHGLQPSDLAGRVRASFVAQVAGWRARGLFERKWMERDFRRHAGVSTDEVVGALDRLVAALEAGASADDAVLDRLLTYYARYENLARDHTRDPEALQTALAAIAAWRQEVLEFRATTGR